MARARVADDFFVKINIQVRRGDEVIFKLSAESVVQSGNDTSRLLGVRDLTCKSDFEHRCDKRGGNAMAGNVGDEDAQLIAIENEKIVEISRDCAHGQVASRDFDSG